MFLPIDDVLPDVVRALGTADSLVLRAETGAGKTTRVPGAVLDGGFGPVVMLEPRRVAARAAARRIASERGGRVGGEVGWHVRFDRQSSAATRLLVVTEGLLVRMLQDDPFLERFGAVILDEFHERTLHADLALAMVRRVQRDVRPDLKLIVMSATLDVQPLARFLGDSPVIESRGRQFPVDVRYLPHADARPLDEAVADGVRIALAEVGGTVLAFLPGVREIRWTQARLAGLGVPVMPLYGDLPPAEQDAVLDPGGPRRVVLATNVAETSLTIPGVEAVVDSGWHRTMRRDGATGLDRLELCRISQASAEQRAGRAGRERAGVCLRLWTRREHDAKLERDDAEIHRVDLAGTVLELMCWGERDPAAFPWFEAPPEDAIAAAKALLADLGAVSTTGVTPLGRILGRMPVHVRLARLAIEAQRLGHGDAGALAAAILGDPSVRVAPVRAIGPAQERVNAGFRDPAPSRQPRAVGPAQERTNADFRDPAPSRQPHQWAGESDVLDRIDAVAGGRLDRDALHAIHRGRDALRNAMIGLPVVAPTDRDEAILRAVLAGFPDRVARRRPGEERRGVLVGGRGVRLDRGSAVDSAFFVAVDVDAGERGALAEGLVRVASAIDPDWLATTDVVVCRFDEGTGRVGAVRRRMYRDLVLAEQTAPLPDGDTVADALAEAAAARLDRALPDDPDFNALVGRLRWLHRVLPELAAPRLDDAGLRALLPVVCRGKRSLDDLRRADWSAAVWEGVPWRVREAIDRAAPERITVPSGSSIRLQYDPLGSPALAVKMQEMFGLADTPTIANGRARVVLHLLGPNGRPQQITDDLRSFWATTWPEIRGELRARYPRHAWPEDPWTAPPQAKPRRR